MRIKEETVRSNADVTATSSRRSPASRSSLAPSVPPCPRVHAPRSSPFHNVVVDSLAAKSFPRARDYAIFARRVEPAPWTGFDSCDLTLDFGRPSVANVSFM